MKRLCFGKSKLDHEESLVFSELYKKAKEGGTPSTNNESFYNGKIPFIKIDHLVNNKYICKSEYTITDEGLKKSSAWLIPERSLLLSNGATLGKVAINTKPVSTKQGIIGIVPSNNINVEYFYYLLKSKRFQKRLKRITTRGTMDFAYIKDISKISIPVHTNKIEQEKIGGFLSSFDQLVDKQKKKVELLKEMKKGYQQKLFNQELRFKDENGNEYPQWKSIPLHKLVIVKDGTHESPKYVQNGFPLITSKNLNQDGTLDFNNVSYIAYTDYKNINQRSKVDIGDILFGMIGTVGNPVKIDKTEFAIKNVAQLKTSQSNSLNVDFILNYLKTDLLKKQFYNSIAGGTQKFIGLGKIRDLKIPTPCLEEQDKIGVILEKLNKAITFQEKKYKYLDVLKKGYSQRLF